MKELVYLTILSNPNISNIVKQKEKEYKNYVDEHISNVNIAWKEMNNSSSVMEYIRSICSSFDEYQLIVQQLDIAISNHDISKYGIDEWEAYRKNYYPVDQQEMENNKLEYDNAWKHHYTNNLHHWNWWYLNNLSEKMSLVYVIEMCCDWIAMSMKFGGNAWDWYNKQENIVLGYNQKIWVKEILTRFYNIVVK